MMIYNYVDFLGVVNWPTLNKAGMFNFGETEPPKHTPEDNILGWARYVDTQIHTHPCNT